MIDDGEDSFERAHDQYSVHFGAYRSALADPRTGKVGAKKIASIEHVCGVLRPYRSEGAHDSGDMEEQTPQEDVVFFDCEYLGIYQGICVVFRCIARVCRRPIHPDNA